MTQGAAAQLGDEAVPANETERVAALFGGVPVLRQAVTTPLDAHELLLEGLPSSAVGHLVANLSVLRQDEALERAVGMSIRTFQRRKKNPVKNLTREQSGRTWRFAEILARATAVLGSQEEGELWLERPAMGLDQRRPVDLLATTAGVEIVDQFLKRLEYGVYV